MQLGEVFERFLQQAPISVMFRTLLEHALDPAELDRLFEENATSQYTRELLFSSIVELMATVVCGVKPSVRAAYLASLGEIAASLTAVYEKLKGLEPGVCRALRPGQRRAARAAGPSARRRLARAGAGLPRQDPRRQPPGRHRAPLPATRDHPRRGPAGAGAGGPRPGHHAGHRRRALRGRPRPGAVADRSGAAGGRARRPLDRRPQLLHDPVALRHPRRRRQLPGPAAQVDALLGGGDAVDRGGPGRHRDRVSEQAITGHRGRRAAGRSSLRRIRLELDQPTRRQGEGAVPADGRARGARRRPGAGRGLPAPLDGWRTCSRR